MAEVIITIPGATNITVDDAPASAVVVIFPASNNVVTTVIDRGVLFGVQGAQGQTGGVNTVNGQSGEVTLDTSEIPENPSALYFTNTRVYNKVKAALIAGSNVSFTYNDANQTITIAASGNVLSVNGQTGAVVLGTDNINEGLTNLYFTATRVRNAVLTGLSTATNAIISATDSVLSAFGKIQAQITANLSTLTTHIADTSNPHSVTKAQVGLSNVDNTSDANKPISSATQTALNAKQDTLVSGTNIKTINGTSILGSGDIVTSVQLSYRHDFNVYDYLGKAASGSSESANVWTITRLTIASDGTATVGTATNVSWTGRYTHIYT